MNLASTHYDFVIVGAGIVGLTLARELAQKIEPIKSGQRILVLEKEPEVGRHASGRNSGVVHAGLYYSSESYKARFCVEGHKKLIAYAEQNNLPLLKCGKVIVAPTAQHLKTLETLYQRGQANGVVVKKVNLSELEALEPMAKSCEWALYSPNTAVIDSKAVLKCLLKEIHNLGVDVKLGQEVKNIEHKSREIATANERFKFGFLFNTAGMYADQIAHYFDVGLNYRILPFKGLYWKATPDYARKFSRLIYPAPDIHMPFLGLHLTKTVDNEILFGPTAMPAFGRENYSGLKGVRLSDGFAISWNLTKMLIRNPNNLRQYVKEELSRYRFSQFLNETRKLVRNLEADNVLGFHKVGLRAQLLDLKKNQLEMDFVIENGPHSLHVLNAVSPAFTSAFAFAPELVRRMESQKPLASLSQSSQHLATPKLEL